MARRVAACAVCEQHAEAVFHLEGMDCHEEVGLLERRLKPLAGLEALAADVVGRRLHVKYDAARLTPDAMVAAVGPIGLRMRLAHEPARVVDSVGGNRLLGPIAAGAGLALGLIASLGGAPSVASAFYLAAVAIGGLQPARRALTALRASTLDIHVLMLVAVAGAVALGERFEAASVVFLFALAQWLEARTLERARRAIGTLVELMPVRAMRKIEGVETSVAVDELRAGDIVVVRPGERVAVDGRVVAGKSDVNEASMTGEAWPVDKSSGSDVYAGTLNGRGSLDVEVRHVGPDTRLSRIIQLVEEAQATRAPLQAFVDRFARVYTPAVVVLALVVALVPPLLMGANAASWMYRALVLLVVACPCALVISTPVSFVAALAAAARHGVLVKGGVHFERLAKARVVAFDKTGTLTHGRLDVTDVLPCAGSDREELLRYAASAEARSEHVIGRAIVAGAHRMGVRVPPADAFVSFPGLGVEATVGGRRVLVGNERLLASKRVPAPDEAPMDALRAEGRTVVIVALDGVAAGCIGVADRERDVAAKAVALVRRQGVERAVMLTGDHEVSARATAESLGLDEYRAGLLPEEKHAAVRALQQTFGCVLMVGDGVNDAPALAAADVGIAMAGAGTDAALEAADVALVSDDLLKLPYVIRLARAAVGTIRANVAISLVMKAAFVVMAATGTATLWMAVLADTGASVLVVANALRLLRTR